MSRVSGLGYIGCTVTEYEPWHRLLQEVYGLQERSNAAQGTHHYRLDAQHHRIALYEGDRDALSYLGWEVETREALRQLEAHLSGNGIEVESGDAALAAERAVMELIVFTAPDGIRTEAFFGPLQDSSPFTPTRGIAGYNTGHLGLGHILLMTDDTEATVKWYREMLGFRLTDYIFWDDIEATFLHCNPRHHSLALANAAGPFKGGDLNHIMLESTSMDDVGRAYDIVQERGFPVAMTLGRHSNDHMTSFYVYTPSGWWMEYGFGGRVVDDASWEPKFYDSPKLWGHVPQPPPA